MRQTITQAKKRAALAICAQYDTITAAAQAAEVPSSTLKLWIRTDPVFASAWAEAREAAADRLEQEIIRRAADGYLEPVYYQGKQVGTVRKFSDLLAIFALKAMRPEKYRERHDVAVTVTAEMVRSRLAELRAIEPGEGGGAA